MINSICKRLCSLVFMIMCFSINIILATQMISSNDTWDTTGIVYAVSDNCDYEDADYEKVNNGEHYKITGVNQVFSKTGDVSGTKYYSADVMYNKKYCDVEDVIEILNDSGMYDCVEEDVEMYSDAILSNRSDMYMRQQWYLDSSCATDAWEILENEPGEDVIVAVIDTGVDYTHRDLKNNMWINSAEYYGRFLYDDDGNGIVDDVYGANFSSGSTNAKGDPYDDTKDGHGTHVAGTIAMTAGNGGGVGVAYGAKIMAVKAGNSEGKFTVSEVLDSVNYAVNMGANVINMSFGSETESAVLKSALETASKNCVLVAAAGNNGNTNNTFPASYPFVIGVMAHEQNDTVVEWSNYDTEPYSEYEYELAAPGVDILSTVQFNNYKTMKGTSMATPIVSAAAAILFRNVDKEVVTDPAVYVFGQLTQATGSIANKTDSNGNLYTYKKLNIYDSLVTAPGVNVVISDNIYMDAATGNKFDNEYTVSSGTDAHIYCGYYIRNAWRGASNINIKVSTTSEHCTLVESEFNIANMQACSSIDVGPDNYESMLLSVKGESGKSYTIPLTYKVTATMTDNPLVTFSREYTDTITITIPEKAEDAVTPTPSANSENANKFISYKPSEITVSADEGCVTLNWDKISGADGYNIYRSSTKNKGYKNIATIDSGDTISYIDGTIANGKKYFYKIQGYSLTEGVTVKSERVHITIPKKVKGISIKRNTLKWKTSKGAVKYVVYRSSKKKGIYKKIGTTKNTRFALRNIGNTAGYYKVRACANSSNGVVYGKYSTVVSNK